MSDATTSTTFFYVTDVRSIDRTEAARPLAASATVDIKLVWQGR